MTMDPNDLQFASNSTEAVLKSVPFAGHMILVICVTFLFVSIVWANFATLDEITHAQGKVIPSSSLQVVQNLEGGVVKEILVREGDDVEKDQVLMIIDDTQAASSVQENQVKIDSLKAKIVRLVAETQGKPPVFPDSLLQEAPSAVQSESDLYQSRQKELEAQVNISMEDQKAKTQQLTEAMGRMDQLQKNADLAKKELNLNKPLLAEGVVSEVDILKLERAANDANGELEANKLAIPRLQADINQANQRIQETTAKFTSQAQDELSQSIAQLKQLSEGSNALQDRLHRTMVRSPVKGTVNQIFIHTVGGIIKPGADLVEVVPLEDNLLVQANVKPADVAGLRPGLAVMVKLTAYDFSIYGGLKGTLDHISADTIKGEKGEVYYEIRVKTERNYLEHNGKKLPIKAGMAANVDILTGKKTVLDYLFKPILKAKQDALTER